VLVVSVGDGHARYLLTAGFTGVVGRREVTAPDDRPVRFVDAVEKLSALATVSYGGRSQDTRTCRTPYW